MFAKVPKWVTTDRFDGRASTEGPPSKAQMTPMVQPRLADRCGPKIHTLTDESAVLALQLEKPGATGPRLRPH